MRPLSLQQLTLRYTVMIFGIFVSLALSAYFLFHSFATQQEHQEISHELRIKAQKIAFLVDFYRNIIEQTAREQSTSDLVMFGSPSEAQNWAASKQKLLPRNIGLALVNRDGEVLGNPLALRVGDSCLADLRDHIEGTGTKQPPVHALVAGLEHFDLIANIQDESGIVGALFSSFSLGSLQEELDRMIQNGQQLKLYSGDGTLLASAGQIREQLALPEQVIPVANTDWVLRAAVEQRDYSPLWSKLAVAGATIFLLIILVLYLFSRRLSNIFALDLKAIERLLAQVKDNQFDRHPAVESRLKETGNIMRSIEGLAGEILQYQNQLMAASETDELTGLYNRRAFNQRAKRGFELARRGINTSVVALDMDYLKTANDRFGHAVGDRLLTTLADCLKANTRGTDIAARLGGDEFIVMLMHCERSNILPWFNKVSAAFSERQKTIFPDDADIVRPCTVSAGFAQVSEADTKIEDAITRADEALYAAKGAGRGQIRSSEGEL